MIFLLLPKHPKKQLKLTIDILTHCRNIMPKIKPKCIHLGCDKQARSRDFKCFRHLTGTKCANCDYYISRREHDDTHACIRSKASKLCAIQDCTKQAAYNGKCAMHDHGAVCHSCDNYIHGRFGKTVHGGYCLTCFKNGTKPAPARAQFPCKTCGEYISNVWGRIKHNGYCPKCFVGAGGVAPPIARTPPIAQAPIAPFASIDLMSMTFEQIIAQYTAAIASIG